MTGYLHGQHPGAQLCEVCGQRVLVTRERYANGRVVRLSLPASKYGIYGLTDDGYAYELPELTPEETKVVRRLPTAFTEHVCRTTRRMISLCRKRLAQAA